MTVQCAHIHINDDHLINFEKYCYNNNISYTELFVKHARIFQMHSRDYYFPIFLIAHLLMAMMMMVSKDIFYEFEQLKANKSYWFFIFWCERARFENIFFFIIIIIMYICALCVGVGALHHLCTRALKIIKNLVRARVNIYFLLRDDFFFHFVASYFYARFEKANLYTLQVL